MDAASLESTALPSRGRSSTSPRAFDIVPVAGLIGAAALAMYVSASTVTPALQTAVWNGSHGPRYAFGSETYLADGLPATPAGWLGDVVVAHVVATIGSGALAVLAALAVAAAFAIAYRRAERRGGALYASLAIVLAFATAASAFSIGDRFATDALFSALVLAALDRAGTARFAAAAIVILWSWLSPDAAIGVFYAIAVAAGSSFETFVSGASGSQAPRECWSVAAACAVATVANVATIGYLPASLSALGLDGRFSPYTIAPDASAPLAYHVGFAALLLVTFLVGGRTVSALVAARERSSENDRARLAGASGAGDASVVAVAIVLGLANGALLPIAGVAAAPVLAGAAAVRFGSSSGGRAVRELLPLVVLALGLVAVGGSIVSDRRSGPTRYDVTSLATAIANDDSAHALFCAQPLWCAAALGSHVVVGLYGRAGWPDTALAEQATIGKLGAGWYGVLERHHVDRVLAADGTSLAGLMRLQPGWHETGDDGRVVAFALRSGAKP